MVKQITDASQKKAISREILEALHDWFEVDESREQFIAESADQPFFAAIENDKPVGFLCLKQTGKGRACRNGRAQGVSQTRFGQTAV